MATKRNSGPPAYLDSLPKADSEALREARTPGRPVPRCEHLHVSGQQCGSPAERERRFCYFHSYVRRLNEDGFQKAGMLIAEDALGIQAGIVRVLQMLESMPMTPKTCALMLYALQTASANLKKVGDQYQAAALAHAAEQKKNGPSLLDLIKAELGPLEPPPEGTCE